jgi:hypothetical protein
MERANGEQAVASEIASLCCVLGEEGLTLTWLECTVAERRHGFFFVDRVLRRLRGDRNFQRPLEWMGLAGRPA